MPRPWIWLQLIIGWLPVWALFTVLIAAAHGIAPGFAALLALRQVASAAVLGLVVHRATARLPWPHPFQLRFVAIHVPAAMLFSLAWLLLNSLIESVSRGRLAVAVGPGWAAVLSMGVWMYVMVAGVAYAQRAAERGAQLRALAARSQLAALRSQLHPHFLFNALHTVVQLIPIDPKGASQAAQRLAELLRATFDEHRDLLPLAREWALVQRYLDIEAIRFGERLRLVHDIPMETTLGEVPSFALQTLVENAVRHAATPSVEPTEIRVTARREGGELVLRVEDSGPGADLHALADSPGTGLRRLRERLAGLYGGSAALSFTLRQPHGLSATLRVPWRTTDEADD